MLKRLLLAASLAATGVHAQRSILINNIKLFNGRDEKIITANVLINGNLISQVSEKPIATNRSADTRIIEGKGRFLMPGLIDAHVHLMMQSLPLAQAVLADFSYITLLGAKASEATLMRGFTTVRDLGGPTVGLKRAIDQGLFPGPRIYPSGATISQTGGHGDFYTPNDMPRDIAAPLSFLERMGFTMIADGPEEVLKRVREQLRNGASQIKLMAGGGVSSPYDPLDVTQFSEDEFRAAVLAAENWGTYVTVHAYTPRAIQMAVNSGVKCIDHGQLIDEATVKLLAEKDIWLSLQPFLEDTTGNRFPEGSASKKKQDEMRKGTETAYELAKKYKLKIAFGTDALFDPRAAAGQVVDLTKLSKWFSNFEILQMATSRNAELLALSGPRNPYPNKLGVIEAGAYADMLLVDGNPMQDIKVLTDQKNLVLIMKDGKIVKDLK